MCIYIIQISQTQAMGLRSASRFNMGLPPSYWTGRMVGRALLYMLVIFTYIYIQYIHTHIIHVGLYLPTFFYQITQLCNSTMHCNCGKFGGDPNLQCFQAHGFLYMHLSSTNLRSSELWTLYMVFCMPRNRDILPKWWQNEVQNHRLLELSHHLFTNPWDLPSRMRGFQDFNSINVGDPMQKTYYLEIIETHKIHGFGYIWFLTLDLPH